MRIYSTVTPSCLEGENDSSSSQPDEQLGKGKGGGSIPGRKQEVLDPEWRRHRAAPGGGRARSLHTKEGKSGKGWVWRRKRQKWPAMPLWGVWLFCFPFSFLPEVSGRDFEQTGSLFLFQFFRSKLAGGSKSQTKSNPNKVYLYVW